MKRLTKVIAVTAAAAMSFSCISAYAAQTAGKSGRMSFQSAVKKVEMTEEGKTAKLEAGKITRGIYGDAVSAIEPGDCKFGRKGMNGEKTEMTEEEKAERVEKIKACLAAKLEAGEITQEKYDEAIAAIESGDYKFGRKGMNREKPEMTEEEKAERLEKIKSCLAAKLEAGEITQEKYDEAIAAIESGYCKFGRKNIKVGKNRASDISTETDA